jgi:hypothetical protein
MRKIKDNGRTLKLQKRKKHEHGCYSCEKHDIHEMDCIASPNAMFHGKRIHPDGCGYNVGRWRETLPSKLSRLIKRMVRK